jgi:hypothetical protein
MKNIKQNQENLWVVGGTDILPRQQVYLMLTVKEVRKNIESLTD